MAFVRTKEGTQRIVHEGREYLLDTGGLELPDALAASIQTHVNVTVDEASQKHESARKKAHRPDYA